jgi:hypothetical protein
VWYGQTTPSVAPTTAMAIYWPERFAASKITQLSADFNSGTTSQITGFINCLVVYTVPTSGPSYSVFQFVIPTTGTQLFVPASGTVFAYLEAEIGM